MHQYSSTLGALLLHSTPIYFTQTVYALRKSYFSAVSERTKKSSASAENFPSSVGYSIGEPVEEGRKR